MKRRVSFIVDPNAPICTLVEGEYNFHSAMTRMIPCMEGMGCEMPKVRYRVTYTLAPKHGRLTMHTGIMNPTTKFIEPFEPKADGTHWDAAIVCQLPLEWAGLRFNRRIRLLARKEEADAGLPPTQVQGMREAS